MHRPRQISVQEFDRNEIENDANGARDAVFRLARRARVMPNGNLDDARSLLLHQHGNEAMQFTVEGQAFGQVAAQRAQGAAHVLDLHAGDSWRMSSVAEKARQFADHEMVLPVGPQAVNGVEPLVELVEQHGNVGGIVLQIAVHGDDQFAGRPIDAGLERCRLAEVARSANRP